MISEGWKQYNYLQVFTFDVGEILCDHDDFTAYQAKLTRVLAKADPSPFIQAVTAFQFAKLFARDPELVGRLSEMENQLNNISEFYHARIQGLSKDIEQRE